MKSNLKVIETAEQPKFPDRCAEHPAVRELLDQRDAIMQRLDAARSEHQMCVSRMSAHTSEQPRQEDDLLTRAKRFLAGDTSAAAPAQASVLARLQGEHARLTAEISLLERALGAINSRLQNVIERATAERLRQPDFLQAREALENAMLNLLEVHRAGLALTEAEAAKGWHVSERTGDRSWAHLDAQTAEELETLLRGEIPYRAASDMNQVIRLQTKAQARAQPLREGSRFFHR